MKWRILFLRSGSMHCRKLWPERIAYMYTQCKVYFDCVRRQLWNSLSLSHTHPPRKPSKWILYMSDPIYSLSRFLSLRQCNRIEPHSGNHCLSYANRIEMQPQDIWLRCSIALKIGIGAHTGGTSLRINFMRLESASLPSPNSASISVPR